MNDERSDGRKRFHLVRGLFSIGAFVALSACGQEADWPNRETPSDAPEPSIVSAGEARAAAALSVSGATMPESLAGYAGEVVCAAAIQVFAQRAEEASILSDEQIAAFKRAAEIFETRYLSTASKEGKTAQQARSDFARARTEAAGNASRSAQNSLACIRSLAAEA